MSVTVYSCINCGGGVRFDISGQKFVCDHCGSKFTLEQMNKAFPDDDRGSLWNTVKENSERSGDPEIIRVSHTKEEEASVQAYNCPACGAEVMSGDSLSAAFCAYCGNPVTVTEKLLSAESLPSRLIPFKLTKEEAINIFLAKCKGKPLLPKSFKTAAKLGDFQSVYIPFYLYDSACSASVTARCQNVSTWSDSDYRYTKTDTYEARRAGAMDFTGVPVDVSEKIDDSFMRAVEPFDMSAITGFSQKYLSGHFAESATTKPEALKETLYSRLSSPAQNALLSTVTGYGSVTLESGNVSIDKAESEYVMFPVWTLTRVFNGVTYIYAINGQTGKFAGKLPVDSKYAGLLFLKMAAIIFAIMFLVMEVYVWIR
ncbi:MAG: zinc ribbon domain-containing protein [Clostridiales bacterium]|jgi:DNA-directed RNA polymerase subunit RPC12/RpoP|nr:zinc ribbon domain-containing protein [Clostridiales bacterium]